MFCLFVPFMFALTCCNQDEPCLNSSGSNDIDLCIEGWSNAYLEAYFDTLKVMTEDFDDDALDSEVQAAHEYAIFVTGLWCCCSQTTTQINLSDIVVQKQFDTTLTAEERDDYIALNNWLGLVSPNAVPGSFTLTTSVCQ